MQEWKKVHWKTLKSLFRKVFSMSENSEEQKQFEEIIQETNYKEFVFKLLESLKEEDFQNDKEKAICITVLVMKKLSFFQVVKVQNLAVSLLTQEEFNEVFL